MKSIYKKLIALVLCALMAGSLFNWSYIKPDAEATLAPGDKPTDDLGRSTYTSGVWSYRADLPETLESNNGLNYGNSDRFLPSNGIVITGYRGSAARVAIPSQIDGYTVKGIGSGAFTPSSTCHSENMTTVNIPSSVIIINTNAFKDCSNLTKVVLHEGLECISNNAFTGCYNLTDINLPSTIVCLGMAFNGTGITDVTVPAAKDALHDRLEFLEPGNFYPMSGMFGHSNVRNVTINKNNVEFLPGFLPEGEVVFNGTVIFSSASTFGVGTYLISDKVVFRKGLATGIDDALLNSGNSAAPVYTRTVEPDGSIVFYKNGYDAVSNPPQIYNCGDYDYILNSYSQAIITAYNGTETAVVIPEKLDGHTVTKINTYAFKDDKTVTDVVLPRYVQSIGTSAFARCTNLSHISLPQSLKEIGTSAFAACNALCDIYLPNSLQSIGDYAFSGSGLVNISLPHFVGKLGNGVFFGCRSLRNVSCAGSVVSIGYECFKNCDLLTAFDFPDGIETIDSNAFEGTGIINAEISGLKYAGQNVFKGSHLRNLRITGNNLRLFMSFSGAGNLKTVEMGDGITAIYSESFRYCPDLETITIGKDTAYIANDAFPESTKLKTLYYNAASCATQFSISVSNMRDNPDKASKTYYQISPFRVSFDNIYIGSGVRSLGEGLFANQNKITSIYLPSSLKIIRMLAFFNCSALTSITWNSKIKIVKDGAFWGCDSLEDFNFNNLASINLRAFADMAIVTASLGTVSQPADSAESGESPEQSSPLRAKSAVSASSIEEEYYEEEEEQACLTVIAEESFENNMSLETIGIGGTVETIETKAFANCENLEKAVISDSVTEIANDAFINCPKLTIYCTENSPAHLYARANGIRVTTLVIDPIPNQVYSGKAKTPEVNVSCSGDKLEKGVDYGVTYSNNINAGTANVYVNGKGDFDMLSSTAHFVIYTKDISYGTVSSIPTQNYTGKEVTPAVKVKVDGRMLIKGTDYDVTYYNNVASGTATVRINGKGNYSGLITKQFEIKSLSSTEIIQNKIMEFIRNIFDVLLSLFSRAG